MSGAQYSLTFGYLGSESFILCASAMRDSSRTKIYLQLESFLFSTGLHRTKARPKYNITNGSRLGRNTRITRPYIHRPNIKYQHITTDHAGTSAWPGLAYRSGVDSCFRRQYYVKTIIRNVATKETRGGEREYQTHETRIEPIHENRFLSFIIPARAPKRVRQK